MTQSRVKQEQQRSVLNDNIRQVTQSIQQLAQTLSLPPSTSETPLSSSSEHQKPKVIIPKLENQAQTVVVQQQIYNQQPKTSSNKTRISKGGAISSSELYTQSKLKQGKVVLKEIDFPAMISSSTGGCGLPRPYGPFQASRQGNGNAQWNRLPLNFKSKQLRSSCIDQNDDETFQAQILKFENLGEFCQEIDSNEPAQEEIYNSQNLKSRPQIYVKKGGDFCASFLRQIPDRINCLGIDCGKKSEFDFLREDYLVVENPENQVTGNNLEGDKLQNLFEMLDMEPNLNTQLPEELSLPRRKIRKGW